MSSDNPHVLPANAQECTICVALAERSKLAQPHVLGAGGRPTGPGGNPLTMVESDDEPLTIAQAKARLARTLGVAPASIKITVEA